MTTRESFYNEEEKAKVDPKETRSNEGRHSYYFARIDGKYDVLRQVREEIGKDSEVEEYFKILDSQPMICG